MLELAHIIYKSKSKMTVHSEHLLRIRNSSRFNNLIDQITGLLIYSDNRFFQILEGKPEIIARTYEKISQDNLHHQLELIEQKNISERSFGKWAMGLAIIDEHSDIFQQLNEYFNTKFDLSEIHLPESTKLLNAFSKESFEQYVQ